MNIIQIQERLKDVSDNELVSEMQRPSGSAPQYLVLSELQRRKRMRDDYQRQQAQNMPTVAEEMVSAAGVPQGGIMDAARAMAPKSSIAQDTGVNDMMPRTPTRAPQEPMRMQAGGPVVRASAGMDMYDYMSDPAIRALANQQGMTVEDYVNSLSPEMRRIILDTVNRPSPMPMRPAAPDMAPEAASRPGNAPDLGISRVMGPIDFDATLPDVPAQDGEPFTADIPLNRMARATAPAEAAPDIAPTRNLPMVAGSVDGLRGMSRGDSSAAALPSASMRPDVGGIASIPAMAREAGPTPGMSIDELRQARTRGYEPYDPRTASLPGGADVLRGLTPEFGDTAAPEVDGEVSIGGRGRVDTRGTTPLDLSGIADLLGIEVGQRSRQDVARNPDPLAGVPGEELLPPSVGPDGETTVLPELNADSGAFPGMPPMDAGFPRMEGDEGLTFGELAAGTAAETDPEAGGGAGTGGGGAGGAGGMSDLERLMSQREKRAQQDKWLALAQFGMQLMSSTQPTLGGALGEAGLTALSGMREAEKSYEEDMLDYLTLQQRQRALSSVGAAGAAAGPQLAKMGDIKSAIEMIDNILESDFTTEDPVLGTVTVDRENPEYMRLMAERQRLLDQYLGRVNPVVSAANLPPAATGGVSGLSMGQ